jgi:GNAT superfamily N-acetyltransferase
VFLNEVLMRQLMTFGAVAAATGDSLVRWVAQALLAEYPGARGKAWQASGAVAVFAPGLYRGDRLMISGEADGAAELLSLVAPRGVPALCPSPVASGITARLPGWRSRAVFGWMDLSRPPDVPATEAQWLPDSADDAVQALLNEANPRSYVFPGDPGVREWAGIRSASGQLISVGADVYSAPCLGFVGGVATHPEHRGRGLSKAVCGFLVASLYERHGMVALMVDADNTPAIKVYRRLGFQYRSITVLTPPVDSSRKAIS